MSTAGREQLNFRIVLVISRLITVSLSAMCTPATELHFCSEWKKTLKRLLIIHILPLLAFTGGYAY